MKSFLILILLVVFFEASSQVYLTSSDEDSTLFILDCAAVEEFGTEDSLSITKHSESDFKIQFPYMGTITSVYIYPKTDSTNNPHQVFDRKDIITQSTYDFGGDSTIDLSSLNNGSYYININGCHVGCPLTTLNLTK